MILSVMLKLFVICQVLTQTPYQRLGVSSKFVVDTWCYNITRSQATALGIRQEVEEIRANVFYSTFLNVFIIFATFFNVFKILFLERFLQL